MIDLITATVQGAFVRILLTLLVLVACCESLLAEQTKPNVLMISIDDLNDWVGCLGGHPQTVTPNIDRLAKQGVLFTNAHCQAPVCTSSRASLMTGLLPSSNGIYLLGGFNIRKIPAMRGLVTLPEAFAEAGYDTIGTGKIFDSGRIFATNGRRPGLGPWPKKRMNMPHGHKVWDWGAYPERDEQLPDVQTANFAIEQLKKERKRPFFLAVGFIRPHAPMFVPQKWFDLLPEESKIRLPPTVADDRDDLPDYGKRLTYAAVAPRHDQVVKLGQWQHAVQSYLASVSFVDAQVGRVLDALDASGQRENTIVVLFSDHGMHLGEKQRWGKRSLWERSTKVPVIVAVPDGLKAARCDEAIGLIDIYPTLIQICGLKLDKRLEGTSFVPQLKAPKTPRKQPTITTFWVNNHAVRSKRYRYIRYADGSQELYDHERDPNEWKNLAEDSAHAKVIAEHARWLPKTNVAPLPGNRMLDVAPGDRKAFGIGK